MYLLHRIIVAGVIVIGVAVPSLACLCKGPNEESLQRADVVFVGKLLQTEHRNKAAFEVQKVIKGSASGRIEIDISQICEFDIFLGGQGSTYVVFAQKHEGLLSLEGCGGTSRIEAGQTPEATCDNYERERPLRPIIVTVICVSSSLLLGFLVSLVRKRFR